MESIEHSIDGRKGVQIIASTWTLPKDLKIQWDTDKVKSISIVGFIISRRTR